MEEFKKQMYEMISKTKITITKKKFVFSNPKGEPENQEYKVTKSSKSKYSLKFKDGTLGVLKVSGKKLLFEINSRGEKQNLVLIK